MLLTKRMCILLALCLVVSLGCEPPKRPVTVVGDGDAAVVHRVDITTLEANRPTLYIELPDACPVPDGTTLDDETGTIYLNVPNYVPRDEAGKKKSAAILGQFGEDGKFQELLDYEAVAAHPVSKEVGPMGMDIGPDGHIYVADNQFFCEDGDKGKGSINSRVLRVLRKDGKVTGEVEVAIDGIKLANALVWNDGILYVTDTQIKKSSDSPEAVFGEGGVWRFTADEVVGKTDIKVDATVKGGVPADSHLAIVLPCTKIGRGDNSGLDGATWAWGALYSGNFGDGVMFRIEFDEAGKATSTIALNENSVHCCDGIFYDAATDLIYICDSQANAIRTLNKDHKHGWLWVNDDTTGDGGLLDQPAECIVRGDTLYVVNFDWPFPGLKNTANDKPHTISAIKLTPKTVAEKVVEAVEAVGGATIEKALDGAELVKEKTAEVVEEVKEAAEPVVEKAAEVTEAAVEKVVEVAEDVKEAAEPVIEKAVEGVKDAAEAAGDAVETAVEKVEEAVGFKEEAPVEEVAVEEVTETAVEEVPVEEAPAPAEEAAPAPAEEAPVEEAPAEEVPVEDPPAPAEEAAPAPAEEAAPAAE